MLGKSDISVRLNNTAIMLCDENLCLKALSEKFNGVFRSLSGRGRITEANVSDAMREVRKALLEADVNYNVVKQFVKDVQQAARERRLSRVCTRDR